MFWVSKLVQFVLVLSLLFLSLRLRTPLLASIRTEMLWLLPIGLGSLWLLNGFRVWSRQTGEPSYHRWLHLLVVCLCTVGLTIWGTTEGQYHLDKRMVLQGDGATLLGQHFVVGYRNFDQVRTLVEKGGIGGIFITRRNLEGQTIEQLQQQIASLQAIRQDQQLPPLWIATDQEGGIVSRLSPPLTHLPPLADVVSQAPTAAARHEQVQSYGTTHGRELAALGINLNFAPVVDLNKGIVNERDRFSVIYRRAISADKVVVADVAQDYCMALFREGVYCTLKHFPGLGRVDGDTHLTSAHLNTPVAELEQDDWIPFQQVMRSSNVMTMLGHPILTAVDPNHPVSFSKAVVNGILRQQWQHEGLLITDDFSMGAVFNSHDGVTEATLKALNAGVDLILLSYDVDLYYPVMAALLRAAQDNRLSVEQLAASRDRLQHHHLQHHHLQHHHL
ncbi:MAG: glycoside hydrolase family 3 protein [Cyanothece sp. SIO2G6]|nr:glycoside hydrolase family 3 protein [Cyanothece sp. SIO2G6]